MDIGRSVMIVEYNNGENNRGGHHKHDTVEIGSCNTTHTHKQPIRIHTHTHTHKSMYLSYLYRHLAKIIIIIEIEKKCKMRF